MLQLHHYVTVPICSFYLGSDPPPSKQPFGFGRCNNLKVQATSGLFTHLVKRDSVNPWILQTKPCVLALLPLCLFQRKEQLLVLLPPPCGMPCGQNPVLLADRRALRPLNAVGLSKLKFCCQSLLLCHSACI